MDSKHFEILLVEDNPDEARLTMRTLSKASGLAKIMHMRDGEDVFAYMDERPKALPRLILLDLKMPKIDGIGVLRRVKADAEWKVIPVVMLTSSNQERDVVESYRLGVNAYIIKPVSTENFNRAIHDIGNFWLTLNHTVR